MNNLDRLVKYYDNLTVSALHGRRLSNKDAIEFYFRRDVGMYLLAILKMIRHYEFPLYVDVWLREYKKGIKEDEH